MRQEFDAAKKNLQVITADSPQRGSVTAQGLIGLLGLFAGLCSIFAGVVSVADAWREHNEAAWPAVTATIEKSSVVPYHPFRSQGRRIVWHIDCRISYEVGAERLSSQIRSRSAAAEKDISLMHQWVAQHRQQSWIEVHYDPSNHSKAVLVTTDMPFAGPRTPDNLRLLFIAVVACMVLVTLARMMRTPQGSTGTIPAR